MYEFDTLTINERAEDVNFSFDDEIVDSTAYRAAFIKQSVRNASNSMSQAPNNPESEVFNPALKSHFSRTSSSNSSSWAKASTIAASETSKQTKEKKNSRWNFVPLVATIGEKKNLRMLQEQLCAAALQGDLKMVEELIVSGANPAEEKKLKKQGHCLMNALQSGSTEVVKFLLEKGAIPKIEVLQSLCMDKDCPELVKILLDHGADPNAVTSGTPPPLHMACRGQGLLETARVLIEHNAAYEAKWDDGFRPLHYAVESGNLQLVSLLLDVGADPAATTTKDGLTPLHRACDSKTTPLSIIQRLVAGNADVNAPSQPEFTGFTALPHPGFTALFFACAVSRKDVVAFLLESNANLQCRCGNSYGTPLHFLSKGRDDDMLNFLIEKGADLTARDSNGDTALHWACSYPSFTAVRTLVSKGADVNCPNRSAYTPLHTACSPGYPHISEGSSLIIQYLLQVGADPLRRDRSGKTPAEYFKLFHKPRRDDWFSSSHVRPGDKALMALNHAQRRAAARTTPAVTSHTTTARITPAVTSHTTTARTTPAVTSHTATARNVPAVTSQTEAARRVSAVMHHAAPIASQVRHLLCLRQY